MSRVRSNAPQPRALEGLKSLGYDRGGRRGPGLRRDQLACRRRRRVRSPTGRLEGFQPETPPRARSPRNDSKGHARRAHKWRSVPRGPSPRRTKSQARVLRWGPISLRQSRVRASGNDSRHVRDLKNREARNRHAAFRPCVGSMFIEKKEWLRGRDLKRSASPWILGLFPGRSSSSSNS